MWRLFDRYGQVINSHNFKITAKFNRNPLSSFEGKTIEKEG
jgi:hypothetical protein